MAVVSFRSAVRLFDRIMLYLEQNGIDLSGIMLSSFAIAIVTYVTTVGVLVLVPRAAGDNMAQFIFMEILALFFVFNIGFNYYYAYTTDAGSPDDVTVKDSDSKCRALQLRVCKKCGKTKPPRCHHCRIKGSCVLKMDHFCPWVNNTLGHRNYRYFYLFMLYAWSGVLYAAIFSYEEFLPLVFPGASAKRRLNLFVSLTFLTCVAVLLALGLLLGYHTYLLLSNQTTIEHSLHRAKRQSAQKLGKKNVVVVNVFDMGPKKNFESVFGEGSLPLRWLLPSHIVVGDGASYAYQADIVDKMEDDGIEVVLA